MDNLNNKFAHLCNNSINAYAKNFNETDIKGNMWTVNQLQQYLKDLEGGQDVFNETIRPKLKDIVKYTIESVQDLVESRPNTVELYGFDFMVDEDYNVWLIEVNSSPSMDYSTVIILLRLTMQIKRLTMNEI